MNKLNSIHDFEGNREAWCIAISDYLLKRLDDEGIASMPNGRRVKVSIAPISRSVNGICYSSGYSEDKNINHIVISPTQAADTDLCKTLLHELIHAIDDCNSGHRGRWKRIASTFGMTSTSTFDQLNELGQDYVTCAIQTVGRLVEHERQVLNKNKRRPSLVQMVCPVCSLKAYVSSKLDLDKIQLYCAADTEPLRPTRYY